MKPELVHIVKNQSSREGGRPKLIVLHTTEGPDHPGLADLESLASEFDNPESDASAHMATDSEGNIARYVNDENKAWACCFFNPYSLNCEQVGFAAFPKKEWFSRPQQLKATAAICAEWHIRWGIPLRTGKVIGAVIARTGVVQHKNLGTLGCGHSDCGPGYPQGYVVRLAKLIVEEHHLNRPHSKRAKRLRWVLNLQRKRNGLPPFATPNGESRLAGTKTA
jgi:hypothetical protein